VVSERSQYINNFPEHPLLQQIFEGRAASAVIGKRAHQCIKQRFNPHKTNQKKAYCDVHCTTVFTMLTFLARYLAFLVPLVAANAQDVSNLFTRNGYDNVGGVDSICWFASVYSIQEVSDQIYYSPDVAASNSLVTGPEQVMDSCPTGTSVHVEPPLEVKEGQILRTGQPYSFEISASIDLHSLRKSFNLSDTAVFSSIAGRLVFCPPNGIFCSPFVIEQAQAILDHNLAEETSATNSTDHMARDRTYYDLINLSLLKVVNHSSPWHFQPVVEGATNSNSNINMTVDVYFADPGQYLPLGKFES
jgi:hypothetical protein